MLRYIRIWCQFFATCLAREIEYRGHFLLQFMVDMVWYGVQIGLFEVIYLSTDSVAGFSRDQMAIFLATVFMTDAVNMVLFSHNFWDFPEHVRKGDLDYLLVKPTSVFFMAFFRHVNIPGILNFLFGVVVLFYGLQRTQLEPSIGGVCTYLVLCLCSVLVSLSMQIVVASLSIITIAADQLLPMVYTVQQLGERPDAIYSRTLRRILTYLLPMAVLASIPTRALLGMGTVQELAWSVIAASVMISSALWFFYSCLRRYAGASA
jgi:ABC-2 type transport system permease protein